MRGRLEIALVSRKFLFMLLLCSPLPAFAYVDPGSGMLIWQGLLAALGVLIAFVRNPWQAIKDIAKRILRKK